MAKKPKSGPEHVRKGRARKERALSIDDVALWDTVVKEVKPLTDRKVPPKPAPKPIAQRKTKPLPPTHPSAAKPLPARHPPAPMPTPSRRFAPADLEAGAAPGLDRRTMTRLGRGKIRPEATIDLHGRTQAEARRALDAALSRAEGRGHRCVLVITGTGLRREGSGVLRTAVPRWLSEAPNRGRVLGYATARPEDGGLGAIYVYLKRAKKRPPPLLDST